MIISLILLSLTTFLSPLSYNGSKIIKIGLSFGIDEYDSAAIDYATAIFLKSTQLHSKTDLIDPDARIELVFQDNKLRKKDVISTNIHMIQDENIAGMIGSMYSRFTILSSLLAQTEEGLPICCGSSTNPKLSDKSQFPNFFRTIPNDNQQAIAFYKYLLYNNWKHVAVIYSSDEYGTGLMETFSILISNKIIIDCLKSIDIDASKEEARRIVDDLKESDLRIFVYFGQYQEFSLLINEAKSAGLYKSGFAWLASEAIFINMGPDIPEGLLVFYPKECDDEGCPKFLETWKKSRLTSEFQFANQSSEEPTAGTFFMVSCFELMVLGFDRILKSSGNITVTDLVERRLGTEIKVPESFSFSNITASGKVLFDGLTGDRIGSYGVYNVMSDLRLHQIAVLESDGSIRDVKTPVYPGGSNVKPKDQIDPSEIEDQLELSIALKLGLAVALFVVGLLLLIISIALLVKFRESPYVRNGGNLVTASQIMGLFLGLSSILMIPMRPSSLTCQLESWILPFSFSLYYGMQFSKSFRIYRIYKGGFGSTSSNYTVFCRGILWSLPILVLTLVWNIIDPPIPALLKNSKNSYLWTCQSSIQDIVTFIYMTYGAILLICNLIIAFICRRIPSVVNETQKILLSIYNVLAVMILGLPLIFLRNIGISSNLVAKMVLIFYIVIFNLIVNFLAKVYHASTLNKKSTKEKAVASKSSATSCSKEMESNSTSSIDGSLIEVSLKDCDSLFPEFHSKFLTCSNDRKSYVLFYDLEKRSLESNSSSPGSRALAWVFANMRGMKVFLKDKNILRISFDAKTYLIAFKDHIKAEAWASFFQSMALGLKNDKRPQ